MTNATATPTLTIAEQAAAAGDNLTSDQFGRVVAALECLRLPAVCLERDLKAIQQYKAASSVIESIEARRP